MRETLIKNIGLRTDFLFPKRSFLKGFSSVINIFGESSESLFNTSKSEEEADSKALSSDWEMIGRDFKKVINNQLKLK